MDHLRTSDLSVITSCCHCGQVTSTPLPWVGKSFCCKGCIAVFQLLQSQNLHHYYELKDQRLLPASNVKTDFSYVEQLEFTSRYAYGDNRQHIDIHVGGVQCAACLWLLEKLPQYISNAESCRLDLGTQVLRVTKKNKASFRPVFEQIQNWGYVPQAVSNAAEQSKFAALDFKSDLLRLGVAAFCAGNVMLIAVSLYAGADGVTKSFLQYVSLLLTLPVMGYSALPLFKGSILQLKSKRISVDLPVSIAVITAFFVSIYGLLNNSEIYFDSITALIFMILTTRFIFKRVHTRHLSEKSLNLNLDVPFARKIQDFQELRISPGEVKKGDRIRIEENEIIPVDGRIDNGFGYINQSLLTGESAPSEVSQNEFVFMGSTLLRGNIEIIATQDHATSRIPKLLAEIESQGPKPNSLLLTEQVGQYFLYSLFAIVGLILFWKLSTNPSEAIYRSLSFIIVACPCTFASVIPLVLSLSLRGMRNRGIFIRNITVFERIGKIHNIFFDKTGTLTEGSFEVLNWNWLVPENPKTVGKICSALIQDEHPVAKALATYIVNNFGAQALEHKVRSILLPAQGVETYLEGGDVIRILKALPNLHQAHFVLNATRIFLNGIAVADVCLGDTIRAEAPEVVNQLKNWGYQMTLLSGDQKTAVDFVGEALGIPTSQRCHSLTLEQKADRISQSPTSIMVGDGNNDALAIQAATIGISVSGGVETALKSSDVYLANRNLRSLVDFLTVAKKTNRLVKQALVVSVIYNVTAGTLAIFGVIHPLLAALIMPVNALTSLGLSFWSLRRALWT